MEDNNCTNCSHFKFVEEWEDGYGFSNYYCCELQGEEMPWKKAQENRCGNYCKSCFSE